MPRKTRKEKLQTKAAKETSMTLEGRYQKRMEEDKARWEKFVSKLERGPTGRIAGLFVATLHPPKPGAENILHKALGNPYAKMTEREYATCWGQEELERSKEIYASMQAQKAAARNERRRMKRQQAKFKEAGISFLNDPKKSREG